MTQSSFPITANINICYFCIPLQKIGSITYNGHEQDEFCVQRASAYTTQNDSHIAELTVRETFDFANRCQGLNDTGILDLLLLLLHFTIQLLDLVV